MALNKCTHLLITTQSRYRTLSTLPNIPQTPSQLISTCHCQQLTAPVSVLS